MSAAESCEARARPLREITAEEAQAFHRDGAVLAHCPIKRPNERDSWREAIDYTTEVKAVGAEELFIEAEKKARDWGNHDLAPLYEGCDLVLIEGDVSGPGPSVEIHRATEGGTPLALEREEVVAVVSDDALDVNVPIWPRSDVARVAEQLLALV